MTIEVALLISFVSVAFSVYFGLKNSKHTSTKEIEERVKNNTTINIKLDGISESVKEIKTEILAIKQDMAQHNDRLIKVEESVKSAHHRLDTLTSLINGGALEEKQ